LAGAAYNFRVKSREITGTLATSSNFTFTTTAGPPAGSALVYLKFDETGGTVATDSSGNGLNGTLVNTPTFMAGKIGNAINLNGTSQSVDVGNATPFQLTGSMTVSAWINAASFPGDDNSIVSKRDGSALGFQLDTTVDSGPRTIGFKLTDSSGSLMARYGSSALAANTWYYVTGVYDATAQTLNVYLNGNLNNGVILGTVTSSQQTSALDVFVGRRAGYDGFEFAGRIDDVRIYGRALTQAQIQADMNGSAPTSDTTAPIPGNSGAIQTVSAP
jgi:hypothetical protein